MKPTKTMKSGRTSVLRSAMLLVITATFTALLATPAIASATTFRVFPAANCVAYFNSGKTPIYDYGFVWGGPSGGSTIQLVCPVLNDSDIPINNATSPAVHLTGYNHSGDIFAQTCFLGTAFGAASCSTIQENTTTGDFSWTITSTDWESKATEGSYFVYVEPGDVSDKFLSYSLWP